MPEPSGDLRRFSGHVAHDLNNMLSAVVGYGELIRAGLPDHHPLRAYAEDLMVAAHRGCSLARGLAALGGRIPTNPLRMSTRALAAQIVSADAVAGPAVLLEPGTDGQVRADPEVLTWAWRQVFLQVNGLVPEDRPLRLAPRSDGVTLFLQRSLTAEESALLFTCYAAVTPASKGGLGVAILATIAEQSGGRLAVTGSGLRTGLTLTLPVIGDEASGWSGRTVLLLASDDAERGQAERLLIAAGAIVLAAEDTTVAAGLVRVYGGGIDAVVADLEAVIPIGVTAPRTTLAELMTR